MRLSDAMVLVAAVACGLGLLRTFDDVTQVWREVDVHRRQSDSRSTARQAGRATFLHPYIAPPTDPRTRGGLIAWAARIGFWPGPVLAALTIATLILSLRRPRPPLRRLARRPGVAAAVAVVLAAMATAIRWPLLMLGRNVSGGPLQFYWLDWWAETWASLPDAAGLAVLVAWSILALSGRWAARPDLSDRFGRAVGVGWIATALAGLASAWLRIVFL